MKIPITKPFFGEEENKAILAPLESGWIVQGPEVKKFEEKFSRWTKSLHSAACTSCTTALHLAVSALGLKSGDEVIVPAFTWVSTANVVEYQGAKPIFCDIDLYTFNIDPSKIENLITSKTVGMIPVHLFGLVADMDPIMAIARKHKLWIVEDAACAFGGMYKGKHAGLFGDVGCFSFHPRKSITTGEGGMCTTQSKKLDHDIRSLRDHGATKSDLDRHSQKGGFLLADYTRLGFNYRMTDLQGAIGHVQLDRANWILKRRNEVAEFYKGNLSNIPWLKLPFENKDYIHGYQSYVCLFSPEKPSIRNVDKLYDMRNKIMAELEEKGVATRQGTHAPVLTDFYSRRYGFKKDQFPNSLLAERVSLSLPIYAQISEEELTWVCSQIKEIGQKVVKGY